MTAPNCRTETRDPSRRMRAAAIFLGLALAAGLGLSAYMADGWPL